jgi:hypothetical protein
MGGVQIDRMEDQLHESQRRAVPNSTKQTKSGISARGLKWIAMLTMLVDHSAVAIVFPLLFFDVNSPVPLEFLYELMRGIGRFAFPLFIYLLVDSFFYTRNRVRFIGGMFLFALISEFPFDVALFAWPTEMRNALQLNWNAQNVFFTLAIGALCMMLMEAVQKGSSAFISERATQNLQRKDADCISGQAVPKERRERSRFISLPVGVQIALMVLIAAAGLWIAENEIRSDYGWCGVAAILAAYLVHKTGRKEFEIPAIVALLLFSSTSELIALVDIVFISVSNGTRGKIRFKWMYYLYYPGHLAVLALFKYLITAHFV